MTAGRTASTAGRILVTLLGSSWRIDYRRSRAGRSGRSRGLPVLFAFWHGRQLPLIYTHRGEGITVLVSMHRDGGYVAGILESMGFATVRGSTTRGGAGALRRMAAVLRRGADCAITPDGPRGPAGRTGPGIHHISRLGRRAVVPIATSGSPSIVLRSWDRFRIPLPFCRMVVVEGRPVVPPRGSDPESAVAFLQAEMDRVTRFADFLSSPSGRALEALAGMAGRMAGALAAPILALRPARESRERRGHHSPDGRRPVWLHGSSLGEVSGLLPLASWLGERGLPSYLTCSTPAGRGAIERSGLPGGFAPLDDPSAVGRFLDRIEPSALVLSETEIWPNTIIGALERSIPCMSVNARLSGGSLARYRAIAGPAAGRLVSCFCAVLCRSDADRERFESLGADPGILETAGDSKSLNDPGDPPVEWRSLLPPETRVVVAGSTRPGEEVPVVRAAREAGLFPVLAPRHLGRMAEIEALLAAEGLRTARWSSGLPAGSADVLIVDVHGVLSRLYGLGEIAFVGGTLAPFGGHNILEPLLRGVPVAVGPSFESFADEVGAGVRLGVVGVAREEGLAECFRRLSGSRAPEGSARELGRSRGLRLLERFGAALERAGICAAG